MLTALPFIEHLALFGLPCSTPSVPALILIAYYRKFADSHESRTSDQDHVKIIDFVFTTFLCSSLLNLFRLGVWFELLGLQLLLCLLWFSVAVVADCLVFTSLSLFRQQACLIFFSQIQIVFSGHTGSIVNYKCSNLTFVSRHNQAIYIVALVTVSVSLSVLTSSFLCRVK